MFLHDYKATLILFLHTHAHTHREQSYGQNYIILSQNPEVHFLVPLVLLVLLVSPLLLALVLIPLLLIIFLTAVVLMFLLDLTESLIFLNLHKFCYPPGSHHLNHSNASGSGSHLLVLNL